MGRLKFVHIPRTGGTSISRAIGKKNIAHWIYKRDFSQFSWCVFRHPVDRFISAFNHLSYNQINDLDKANYKEYIGGMNIHEFINHGLNRAIKEQQHFLPQIHWIPFGVNLIVPFNELDKNFKILYPDKELIHVNKTNKKQNLTERDINIILNHYKLDFAIYGSIC